MMHDGPGPDSGAMPATGGSLRQLRTRAAVSVMDVRNRVEMRLDNRYRELAKHYLFPDGSRRVYCHHIRKTAGTSLFLAFLSLGGEDPTEVWRRINSARLIRTISGDYAFASTNRRVLSEGAYYYGQSHGNMDPRDLPPSTFTVTILRDPVRRVHSLFDFLVAGDPPGSPGQVGLRERGWALDGFDAFLDRVPERHLLDQLSTFSWRMDVSEAADRITACSSVFFTEDYATSLPRLGERLGIELPVLRARVTGARSELSEQQVERLRQRMEPEYELLKRLADRGIAPLPA